MSADINQLASFNAADGLRIDPAKLELNRGKKKADFDFNAEVTRMLDGAKQGAKSPGAEIKIHDVGFGGDMFMNELLLDPREKLLRQAQRQVRANEFKDALQTLAKILAEDAGNHEAIHLTALCQARLDTSARGAEQALRTMRPLTGVVLTRSVAARVAVLRDELRGLRHPQFVATSRSLAGNAAKLIPFLREEIALDPGNGVAHCMLACELAGTGRYAEAIAAADIGVQHCTPEQAAKLREVRANAAERLAILALNPVRDLYRKAKYSDALRAIEALPAESRQTRLGTLFDGYLRLLAPKGLMGGILSKAPKPADVKPKGGAKEIDDLGGFLTEPEIEDMRTRTDGKKPGASVWLDVEGKLAAAVGFAPWYPNIRFLYGRAIFMRLSAAMEARELPELDEVERLLVLALAHAKSASEDKEISGTADLIQEIEKLLPDVRNSRHDMALLMPLIDSFLAKMNSIKSDRITSHGQLYAAQRFFDDLFGRIQREKEKLKGEGGKALGELLLIVCAKIRMQLEI